MTLTEPHDLAAERAVLGAMMLSEATAEACRQVLVAGDFYRAAHQVVYEAILSLMREGTRADAVAVADRLAAAGQMLGSLDGNYLHEIIASVPIATSGPYYARIVRGHAITRRLREAARRVMQMTGGGVDDAHGLTERALREFEAVRDAGTGDGLTFQTVDEFLGNDEDTDAYDWVIRGLLERSDRLILTGLEGCGKTHLLRFLAVAAAAGFHPFTFEPAKPVRVLFLDCENTARHTRRKLRPLVTQARLQGHPVDEANLWIECRPQGMDLALDKDTSWLLRQVAAVMPDIVFLGPLYRLAPRALQTDDEAAPILAALNMVRARDCAVVLEAHSGHATGPGGRRDPRPRGSAALIGWPEFGYGLRWAEGEFSKDERAVDLVAWRGDRDERDWPEGLIAGGVWPWRPRTRLRAVSA